MSSSSAFTLRERIRIMGNTYVGLDATNVARNDLNKVSIRVSRRWNLVEIASFCGFRLTQYARNTVPVTWFKILD